MQQVASRNTHHFTLIATEVEIEASGATANVLAALEKLKKRENWWVLILILRAVFTVVPVHSLRALGACLRLL